MEELKMKLVQLCNESGLPLEAIVFVTKDVWRDAQDTFEMYKKQQELQREKELKKEE